MRYQNKKTGVVIDSPCVISGGDWVELKKEKEKEPGKDKAKTTKKKG